MVDGQSSSALGDVVTCIVACLYACAMCMFMPWIYMQFFRVFAAPSSVFCCVHPTESCYWFLSSTRSAPSMVMRPFLM